MPSPGLKWFLLLLCPVCILVIILLHKGTPINILSRSLSSPCVVDAKSQPKSELFFLGNSKFKISEEMKDDDVNRNFFKFLSRRRFACENNARFGNILDGGWDMCLAEPYRPKPPCLVYSFGINHDFSFDDAVARKFNCTVRCFDPSMGRGFHRRSANVWFYQIGIGGNDTINSRRWHLKTLSTIIKSLNDTDTIIDYLKMDVEGSEWPSVTQMLSDGILSKVKQFGVEFHFGGIDVKGLFRVYKMLNQLEDQGFQMWYYTPNLYGIHKTKNGFRSCCYEMVYINTNFLK